MSQEELTVEAPAPVPRRDVFAGRHDGSVLPITGRFTRDSFDELLIWAGERKASDITFQTNEFVKAEIGSEIVRITQRPLTNDEMEDLVRYVYQTHGPGMVQAGYDLDPSHEVRIHGRQMRYRVNVTGIRIPQSTGYQITVRTLPSRPIPLVDLNVEPEIIQNMRPGQGLVLVTGPTGSGKSTLLSSLIGDIVSKPNANEKVLEYSSPIEYVYDGIVDPSASVAQTEVGRHLRPHDGGGEDTQESLYAYAVRNALRRKPTIILIGEARDKATISGCVEAALTGHLVYSTTHVIGVPETLRRLVQPFPAEAKRAVGYDIMQSLRMVVTQLLFPRVGGGRIACREFMIFDSATRNAFLGKDPDDWPALARKMMLGKRAVSRTLSESTYLAYREGLLSQEHSACSGSAPGPGSFGTAVLPLTRSSRSDLKGFPMSREKLVFDHIPQMAETFGEPCSNCNLFDGLCQKGHRTKTVGIATGHIPEAYVRRVGGCSDHVFREGDWYGEEPVRPFSRDYGGTKTNLLV